MIIQSNWISVYIFHDLSFEKVLIELVKPLILQLENESLLLSYFFIRYWENGPHIRLRVLPNCNADQIEIINQIESYSSTYFNGLKEKDLNYSIEFNEYIKESGRYGGKEGILIAEKHFKDSSETVIKILNDYNDEWDYSLAISFALQMHIIFSKV